MKYIVNVLFLAVLVAPSWAASLTPVVKTPVSKERAIELAEKGGGELLVPREDWLKELGRAIAQRGGHQAGGEQPLSPEEIVRALRESKVVPCDFRRGEVSVSGFRKSDPSMADYFFRDSRPGEECLAYRGARIISLSCLNPLLDKRLEQQAAAEREKEESGKRKPAATAVIGVCGAAHGQTFQSAPSVGLCRVGNISPISGAGPWKWTCSGSQGGADSQVCVALAPPTPASAEESGWYTVSYEVTIPGRQIVIGSRSGGGGGGSYSLSTCFGNNCGYGFGGGSLFYGENVVTQAPNIVFRSSGLGAGGGMVFTGDGTHVTVPQQPVSGGHVTLP